MNKRELFAVAFSILLKTCVDAEPAVASATPKKRGRKKKVREPQVQFPDLGIEDLEVPQFDFVNSEPRRPSPPPQTQDDRPLVQAPFYSPSRENDSDGTDDGMMRGMGN